MIMYGREHCYGCAAVCCVALRYAAVRCGVLRCAAVCCGALRCACERRNEAEEEVEKCCETRPQKKHQDHH